MRFPYRSSFSAYAFCSLILILTSTGLVSGQMPRPDSLLATSLRAEFRNGQTFLYWTDADTARVRAYRVLRHTERITDENVSQARVIAESVAAGSGFDYVHRAIFKQERGFVTTSLGEPLAPGRGLFVHTADTRGDAFYAVASLDSAGKVAGGLFPGRNSLERAVQEYPGLVQPVLIERLRTATGTAEVYCHWVGNDMHPREGMAWRFAVTTSSNHNPRGRHPLLVNLHGAGGSYGTAHTLGDDWVILYPDMRTVTFHGGAVAGWEGNGSNFWFGLNSNFYNREDPYGGINVNYDERRLLWTIRWVIENYGIDPGRVHIQGGSMGGFATLNLALRYPELFASAFARVPNVDFFRMSPYADSICTMHWGPREKNILTNEGIGVFDRTDLVKYVRERPEVDFPVIMTLNGKQDKLIGWEGPRLFYQAMQETGHALIAFWSTGGHAGPRGSEYGVPPEHYEIDLRRLRRDESYPALSFASNNHDPGTSADNGDPAGWLNATLFWRDPVDRPNEYGVTIEPLNGRRFEATADVTPRRLQSFTVEPGKAYAYENIDLATGRSVQKGTLRPDKYNLLTVKGFRIGRAGSRLKITTVSP